MEKLIVIGKIGAPHGIKGEVRVIPLTDFPERFDRLKRVILDETNEVIVEQVKYNKQFILLKLKNVESRDDAERLKGKLLQVTRDDVPPLAEGEYYSFDIIGMDVYNESEQKLGKITEILKTGSNDVYVVSDGNGQILVPALKKVVAKIDLASGCMYVILQEEME